MILTVSHSLGPFYLKDKGETGGVYVRLGSTNRIADAAMIAEIKLLKDHISFDQLPDLRASPDDLDLHLANQLLSSVGKSCSKSNARSLELVVDYHEHIYPTKGGLLLFGKRRDELFPDPFIRLVRFEGVTKSSAIDHLDIKSPLPVAIDEAFAFIRRNTSMKAVIQAIRREDIPQYPHEAVREAVINAVLHSDYSTMRSSIQVAIFDDRMEITNPGPLPLGLSLETALSGVSQLRNRVLGRVFRELRLIEQWGSGLARIRDVCLASGGSSPKFEELDLFFRVTLYPIAVPSKPKQPWQEALVSYIKQHKRISVTEAAKLWDVSSRTATSRLKSLCQEEVLVEFSKGPFDPYKVFILSQTGNPANQP